MSAAKRIAAMRIYNHNMQLIYRKQRCAVALFCLIVFCILMLVSCDDHQPVDLDIHPGYILCDDGRIIQDFLYDPSVHTPVAVVFAEKTDAHPILAVLLDEVNMVAFADTLSFDQKTSCSLTEYDGYANTVALQTSFISRDSLVIKDNKADPRNYYTSPLGLLAFNSHRFSQSDYVPSVQELGLLYLSLDRVNAVIVKCGGTPVCQTPVGAGCWYWSSTEVDGNKLNQSWLFSMADGSIHKAPKINCYNARLIVEYNPVDVKVNN